MKVAGAKRDVFPGSSVSTGAKFSVAPVDSAPMQYTAHCTRWCIKNAVTNFLHQLLDRRLCFHQHFFVCLLPGLRKNSTEFSPNTAERWHTGPRRKSFSFWCNPDASRYVSFRVGPGVRFVHVRRVSRHWASRAFSGVSCWFLRLFLS